jgi:neutral amino acid transport system substrate-binding protein
MWVNYHVSRFDHRTVLALRHRKSLSITVLLAASCLVLAACGGSTNSTASTSSSSSSGHKVIILRVGMPIDLTGASAFSGIEQLNVAKAAVDEINSSGGPVRIQLQ